MNAFVNENYEVLGISKAQSEIIQKIISRKEISDTLNLYMENMLKFKPERYIQLKGELMTPQETWNAYKQINPLSVMR